MRSRSRRIKPRVGEDEVTLVTTDARNVRRIRGSRWTRRMTRMSIGGEPGAASVVLRIHPSVATKPLRNG